jgi:hypothetical protein
MKTNFSKELQVVSGFQWSSFQWKCQPATQLAIAHVTSASIMLHRFSCAEATETRAPQSNIRPTLRVIYTNSQVTAPVLWYRSFLFLCLHCPHHSETRTGNYSYCGFVKRYVLSNLFKCVWLKINKEIDLNICYIYHNIKRLKILSLNNINIKEIFEYLCWSKPRHLRITRFLDFGPSSGILKTREHNVSENGSVSILVLGENTPTQLGPYRTMEKVQKASDSECYTLSSEPFRIYHVILAYEYVKESILYYDHIIRGRLFS